MRFLLTGGAGFIGSALCRHLVGELGHEVVNFDKLTYAASLASLESVAGAPGYRLERGDILDRRALDRVFDDAAPDAVIHLAAESHVDRSIAGSADFITTNVVGTYTLLEAARAYWARLPKARQGRFRFIHVSTDEVYGSLGSVGVFTEDSKYDPSSPYSASKASSDHLALAWQKTYGLPVVVSNSSNNYGPFQFPEKLVPLMILKGFEGGKLPVYGDGSNVRDWLHVEDHVRALVLLVERGEPGRKYNVGGRNERTNLQIVEMICAALDQFSPTPRRRRDQISFVTDRPGHDQRYAIDPSRIEGEIGWRAERSVEQGIEQTVRWYLANEAWWRPQRERYAGERLGLIAS